ncbi:universal stress protein [Cellulosimicrobium funkei]|nr:universal stress protein [Cellulosimicrobium funkei]
MTILVAYSHTDEGAAALVHAARLSAKDAADLVIFDLDASSTADDGSIAPGPLPEGTVSDGQNVSWRGPDHQSQDAAGDLLDVAEQIGADAIVVGVRRRSRVGKLILGSMAQKIIIDANVPVIAVKADQHER